MKSEAEIRTKLTKLRNKLQTQKDLYRCMEDVEAQRVSVQFITKTKGEIKSLKWALNEKEN
jgi:hypothetical protein